METTNVSFALRANPDDAPVSPRCRCGEWVPAYPEDDTVVCPKCGCEIDLYDIEIEQWTVRLTPEEYDDYLTWSDETRKW